MYWELRNDPVFGGVKENRILEGLKSQYAVLGLLANDSLACMVVYMEGKKQQMF